MSEAALNSNGPRVRVSFTYQKQDLAPGVRFSSNSKPKPKTPGEVKSAKTMTFTRGAWGWTLILGTAIVLFVVFHNDNERPRRSEIQTATMPGWVIPMLVLLAIGLGLSLWLNWLFIRFSRTSFLRGHQEATQIVDISSEGLRWEGDGYYSVREWRAVSSYKENDQRFDLMSEDRILHIIPKRAMTPEQVETVRAIFNAQIRTEVSSS